MQEDGPVGRAQWRRKSKDVVAAVAPQTSERELELSAAEPIGRVLDLHESEAFWLMGLMEKVIRARFEVRKFELSIEVVEVTGWRRRENGMKSKSMLT